VSKLPAVLPLQPMFAVHVCQWGEPLQFKRQLLPSAGSITNETWFSFLTIFEVLKLPFPTIGECFFPIEQRGIGQKLLALGKHGFISDFCPVINQPHRQRRLLKHWVQRTPSNSGDATCHECFPRGMCVQSSSGRTCHKSSALS